MTTEAQFVIPPAPPGWRLFPVRERGKSPLISDWPKRATDDAGQLRAWAEQYPGCNWGLACGPESGVFVIDCDGATGLGWLQDRTREAGDTWATRQAKTSRGVHLYFRWPENGATIRNSAGKISEGVDVRGEGGYVLIPPSYHPDGTVYEWVGPATIPILSAPAPVLERVKAASRGTENVFAFPPNSDSTGRIPEGARDESLTSFAGTMRRRGMSATAIEAALRVENARACDPPLDEAQVRKIVDSVARYVPAPEPATATALTQDDLAEVLVRAEPDVRFCHAISRWFVFDGCAWREDKLRIVYNRIKELLREFRAQFPQTRMARESSRTYSAVETIAAAHPAYAIGIERLDARPDLLNTPQGTIERGTGAMRPAQPLDYLTKLTAVAPGGDCPLWRAFLKRATNGDQALEDYLQRLAFYCLWGGIEQDSIFYVFGSGANGKSTFVTNLAGALGDYAATSSPEIFMRSANEQHPTGLARLRGARLVVTSEVPDGRWNEEFLKNISGGGKLAARYMRGDFFEFEPTFKLLISGNYKPQLRSVDPAMRRRFNLIPFTATFSGDEIDRELRDVKLPREWPGILQWALDGREEFFRQGLNPPAIVRESTDEYLTEEDRVARWLAECCTVDAEKRASARSLYVSFREWSEGEGESFIPSQKWLARELKKRGFAPATDGRVRQWVGLGLKEIGSY